MVRRRRRVLLPNDVEGEVLEEFSGPGFDYVVVLTEEGHRVTCHPVRLRPVPEKPREGGKA